MSTQQFSDTLKQFAFDIDAHQRGLEKRHVARDYRFVEPDDRKQLNKWLSARPASKAVCYVIYSESLKPGEFLLSYEINVRGARYQVNQCIDLLAYDDWRKYISWHLRSMRRKMKSSLGHTISTKSA